MHTHRYALEQGLNRGQVEQRALSLAHTLRRRLSQLPRVSCTDVGSTLCAIVTVVVEGALPAQVVAALRAAGINASVSAAASGGSRVWYDRRGLSEVVRLAPHYYNTDAEIDAVVAAFEALRV